MFDKIRKRVPSMSNKQIYYTPRVTLLAILSIYFPILIIVVNQYIKQGFLLNFQQFALILSSYLLFFIQFKVNNAISLGISDILYYHIDLERYESYSDFLLLKNSIFFNNTMVTKGIVEFYKGNFKEAEAYFYKVIENKWGLASKTLNQLNYYFYSSLTELYLGNEELSLSYRERLSSDKIRNRRLKVLSKTYSDVIDEILKINSGIKTTYFSDNKAKQNNLTEIMFTFYEGLDFIKQRREKEAKILFQSIVNENPDLFYVQEAKKYLVDL